ncbi:hypothetical protein B0T16DRAFT_456634 [Cercophora newfieldiana]|uniref:Ribosome biogenesis protein SLX9 n=1 Tax=Cercophora newfieldiana TaxID=92897 RepID=A0AA39YAT4_9PEZI|nr:hypothetical protein B0T16DRAFT_456634 [Cercophora newfieldiana]
MSTNSSKSTPRTVPTTPETRTTLDTPPAADSSTDEHFLLPQHRPPPRLGPLSRQTEFSYAAHVAALRSPKIAEQQRKLSAQRKQKTSTAVAAARLAKLMRVKKARPAQLRQQLEESDRRWSDLVRSRAASSSFEGNKHGKREQVKAGVQRIPSWVEGHASLREEGKKKTKKKRPSINTAILKPGKKLKAFFGLVINGNCQSVANIDRSKKQKIHRKHTRKAG